MIIAAPTRIRRSTPIQYLARICAHWGGSLSLLSDEDYTILAANFSFRDSDKITEAPDRSHAIDYDNFRVFAHRVRGNPGGIIHEMGHLFLEEGRPSTTDELEWLGWEIAMARMSGCYKVWNEQNAGYGVRLPWGHMSTWGDLSTDARRIVTADRIDHAMMIGILSPNGVPLRTRTR